MGYGEDRLYHITLSSVSNSGEENAPDVYDNKEYYLGKVVDGTTTSWLMYFRQYTTETPADTNKFNVLKTYTTAEEYKAGLEGTGASTPSHLIFSTNSKDLENYIYSNVLELGDSMMLEMLVYDELYDTRITREGNVYTMIVSSENIDFGSASTRSYKIEDGRYVETCYSGYRKEEKLDDRGVIYTSVINSGSEIGTITYSASVSMPTGDQIA